MPSPRLGSRGFTFVELIVGLAIMVMIASAVTPVVFSTIDRARISSAVAALTGISDALDAFENDVSEHPQTLDQLVTDITIADRNVCGTLYKAGTGKGGIAEWLGPYIDREIPTSGVPIGAGVAQITLTRQGDTNKAGDVIVTITGVSIDDAESLDAEIDGRDGRVGGSIRWNDPGTASVIPVYFHKPTPRC